MNWIVRKMSSSISKPAYRVVTQGGESVCYISMSTPDAKQKAELIAAAPDLLEACEAIWEAHEQNMPNEVWAVALLKVKYAIAKAKGE